MKVLRIEDGRLRKAKIVLLKDEDWKDIDNSGQFNFDWHKEKEFSVYKIRVISEHEILGLISIEDIAKELRVHIRLIENSNDNKGKGKKYDFVAGCLLAYACKIAFENNYSGFVSLKPKTELIPLYKNKYGFKEMGNLLFTELENSENLLKKYISYGAI